MAACYQAIAWGVMNRVRLGEASSAMRRRYGDGVAGVIFRKGQFNPAVSPRSPFSRDFLCPQDSARWGLAMEAAQIALRGRDNPFIQTAWERASRPVAGGEFLLSRFVAGARAAGAVGGGRRTAFHRRGCRRRDRAARRARSVLSARDTAGRCWNPPPPLAKKRDQGASPPEPL
ncbi:MAG: hypothetical protein V9H25_06920 [Candidatus Competibacter sp.]